MSQRKKTPDILGNLLESDPQTIKTLSPQDVLPVKQQDALPENDELEIGENAGASKTKMTFYLSEDSVERLEEAQRTLRRLSKKAGKSQPKGLTSKSALLEAALQMACEELEAKGEKSALAQLVS